MCLWLCTVVCPLRFCSSFTGQSFETRHAKLQCAHKLFYIVFTLHFTFYILLHAKMAMQTGHITITFPSHELYQIALSMGLWCPRILHSMLIFGLACVANIGFTSCPETCGAETCFSSVFTTLTGSAHVLQLARSIPPWFIGPLRSCLLWVVVYSPFCKFFSLSALRNPDGWRGAAGAMFMRKYVTCQDLVWFVTLL